MRILNIPIDNLPRDAILGWIDMALDEPRFHRIVTVNPEFILLAEKEKAFRMALLAADVRIADGVGIILAGFLQGKKVTRFAGADLMEAILIVANEKKLSLFLAIRADGLSTYEEVKAAIFKKYPHLKISGADIDVENFGNWKLEIGNSAIILCSFGAPTQELFLAHLKADFSTLRLAMGVGGSFDYLTGKQRRAPRWMRAIGLEWCWRLAQQPKRFRRIYHAVIVFPLRVFFATIRR